jgi:hypothetical protein
VSVSSLFIQRTMAVIVLRSRSIVRLDNEEDFEGQRPSSVELDESVTSLETQQEGSTVTSVDQVGERSISEDEV